MKAVLEKISNSEASVVTAFHYLDDHFSAPWHYHPEFELTCILESEGIRYVGNNISEYQPLDLVLIGANLPHRWKNSAESASMASSLVIQWKPEVLPDIADLYAVQQLLKRARRGVYFKKEVAETVLPSIKSIVQSGGNKYIQLLSILQQLSQTAAYGLLSGENFAPDLSPKTEDRLDKVQQYVEKHYTEKIALAEVAELVSMTESSFSRFFSRVMQKPFFSFLNEYRVNRASQILIETELSIAETGFSCGYESLPFFYKQFNKIKGYSPMAFRKIHRAQNDSNIKIADRFQLQN
ncbi:MAG: AraC family transcriptional regulator [Bacteroidota bacterium]